MVKVPNSPSTLVCGKCGAEGPPVSGSRARGRQGREEAAKSPRAPPSSLVSSTQGIEANVDEKRMIRLKAEEYLINGGICGEKTELETNESG